MRTILLLALLILPQVLAQIPTEISEQRCGNKALEQFELCEKGVDETKCDDLADLLGIDTACDTQYCTCLPRVNKAFCGNNNREGVELCDGNGEDKCAEFGQKINLTLVCDPKTCGCKINQSVPAGYNPVEIETLTNISQQNATCGNKKVERSEDCDPPNTLCTTNTKQAGVCTAECKCIDPRAEAEEKANISNSSELNKTTAEEDKQTEEKTTEEPEKGFFSKLLSWLAKLFS